MPAGSRYGGGLNVKSAYKKKKRKRKIKRNKLGR